MPVIQVDNREKTPLVFQSLRTETASLYTGDYSIKGLEGFAIERKTISDLASSVSSGRERFAREMERLKGMNFARLLIIGSIQDIEQQQYRAGIQPKAVLNTLSSWEIKYSVPVVFASTPEQGAILIEQWAYYYARNIAKQAYNLARFTD